MSQFTQKEINYIVPEYWKGRTIKALAKELKCRTKKISLALRSRNIDTTKNRRVRIGNAHRGVSEACVSRVKEIRQLSEEEWAYIAGIFDGDGCVSVNGRWSNYRITITQNGLYLHQWLLTTLGVGNITRRRDDKANSYRISAQKQVYEFLNGVLPYSIVKQEKVRKAIATIENKYKWEPKLATWEERI